MKKNINEDITRIKEIMGLLNEVTAPKWVNFLTKLTPKLINTTLEDALLPELKVMEKEGKLTLNKVGNKLESIDFGKLTTKDINILIRSKNFRTMVKEVFNEYLKVDLETISQTRIKLLTGDFQKLAQQFFNTKTRIIVQNFGEDAGKNWIRRNVSKAIRAITKMQPDWLKKITDTYNGTITEQIKLEEEFIKWFEQAASKSTANIAVELEQMNLILLRFRTLGDSLNPKGFYEMLKIQLGPNSKVIKDLENTSAFEELQKRFFDLKPDVKKIPKSTISRWEGYKKLYRELTINPITKEFWGKLVSGIVGVIGDYKNSRTLGFISMLEPRTLAELGRNADIKGVSRSALSYMAGKLSVLYVGLPFAIAAGRSIVDIITQNDDLPLDMNGDYAGNLFWIEWKKHIILQYSSTGAFVADWSPIGMLYFTVFTKKVKEKSTIEKAHEAAVTEVKKVAAVSQKALEDFLIKYPNLRSIADSLVNVGDLKKPEPVTDPVSTVTYETLTSQEVAYYISTNLKGTIPSKTTTNSDNSVDVFVDGQIDPIATIIKQNGEVTIK